MTCSPADAQVSLRGNAAEASEISFIRLGYVCLPCKKKSVLFSVSFRGTRTSFLPFLFNQIHQHTHTRSPIIIIPVGLFFSSSFPVLAKAGRFKDVRDYRLCNDPWRTCNQHCLRSFC